MAINWTALSDEELCSRIRSTHCEGSLIMEMASRLEAAIDELEGCYEAMEETAGNPFQRTKLAETA